MAVDDTTRDTWLLRAVFDVARHGVALLDADGRIRHWNRVAAELTGHPAEVAVGQDLAWLHAGDESAWPRDALRRAAAGETVVHAGWRRTAAGRRVWCEATLQALVDEDGMHRGFAEGFADATDVHVANEAVREARALFDTALRAAPIGLGLQDEALRYTWAPTGRGALGAAGDGDVVGRLDTDLYPPEVADRLSALKHAVLESGQPSRVELAVPRDGETRHYDVTLEPRRDPDSRRVAGVITVAFDITERTRIEEEVERSRTRLAEAERIARIGSWEWDIAENRIVWSDGLYEIYGITREEFDPTYRPSAERVHPDDRERVDAGVARALETCEPIDLEYRIVRPDGRVRRVHGRAEVIVGDDGRPVRLAGTAQDVTDVRATAEALSQAAAELGRRAAELDRIVRPERPAADDLARNLTARQVEILALVAQGLSNAEIAQRLFLSEGTVKWHVRKILRALGVANRAQAIARYLAARPSRDRDE